MHWTSDLLGYVIGGLFTLISSWIAWALYKAKKTIAIQANVIAIQNQTQAEIDAHHKAELDAIQMATAQHDAAVKDIEDTQAGRIEALDTPAGPAEAEELHHRASGKGEP